MRNHHLLYFDQDRWMGSAINTLYPSFSRYDLESAIDRTILHCELRNDTDSREELELFENQLPFVIAISDALATYAYKEAEKNARSVTVQSMFDSARIGSEQASLPPRYLQSIITAQGAWTHTEHGQHLLAVAERASELFQGSVKIQQSMYNGDKRFYRYQSEQRFVEYAELMHELPETYTLFSTNPKKDGVKLSLPTAPQKRITIEQVQDQEGIYARIAQPRSAHSRTFVLCGQKQRARELREYLQGQGLQAVYAENITGGVGKTLHTLAQASQTDQTIIIGSLNFYLAMLTKKFVFSRIISYHMYGHTKALAFNDIIWYSS